MRYDLCFRMSHGAVGKAVGLPNNQSMCASPTVHQGGGTGTNTRWVKGCQEGGGGFCNLQYAGVEA